MTVGINANLCKDVVLSDPDDTIYSTGTITTSATTKSAIVSRQVATGKDFYIFAYSVTRQTDNSTGAAPATLEVQANNGTITVVDSGAWNDASHAFPDWSETRDTGFKIATAGQTVSLQVVPTRTSATVWFGKIIGVER